MKLSLRLALSAIGILTTTTAMAEDKVVNISFWYSYLPEANIAAFAKETGVKIVYDTFNSVEMLTTKILTGKSGYDVILPGAANISQYIKAGAIQKLDKSKIPNLKDLDPELMKFLATQDPSNDYAIPYGYGSTGILYNKAKIEAAMKDAPVNSWDMLFKPEIAAKFKDCGIAISDVPDQLTGIALNYLGLDPYTTKEDDIHKAEALLKSIRPYIRHFKTEALAQEMSSGDLCLVVTWTGTAVIAQNTAKQNKTGVELEFNIPKEGSNIFFDVMTIPADAPHPENANTLINFLISTPAAVNFTNTYQFPSAVLPAKTLVDKDIQSNPNIYLSAEILKRLYADQPRDPKSMRTVVRSWTRFKTGE